MAANGRQISSDWRPVDVSSADYTTEVAGELFVVRVGGSGTITLRNTRTDSQVVIEALDGERIEMLTDTIYAAGNGATNIQAIYE